MRHLLIVAPLLMLLAACDGSPAQRLAQEKASRDSTRLVAQQVTADSLARLEQQVTRSKQDSIARMQQIFEKAAKYDSLIQVLTSGKEEATEWVQEATY